MAKPASVRECIHHWGNQVEYRGSVQGQCGNVRYDGPVLYSYAAAIAVLVPENNVAVVSDARWSITTSSHQSSARNSILHHYYRLIHAPVIDRNLEAMHRANKASWERAVCALQDEFAKHPRRKSLLTAIEGVRHSYATYSDAFSLDWPELNTDAVRAEMVADAERRVSERAARERRLAEERLQAIADEQLDLIRWRAGEDVHRRFITTALRLKGGEIETSRGASVPVEVAPALWRLACRQRNEGLEQRLGNRFQVGHYNLDSIGADGSLHIGCHVIPFVELEHIAVQLGFIQLEECSTEVVNRDAEICG